MLYERRWLSGPSLPAVRPCTRRSTSPWTKLGRETSISPPRPGPAETFSASHGKIIEYRAELGVPTMLRSDDDAELSVENLIVLRNDLRRIATIDYQQHLDVAKLSFDVGQQTLHLWKLLGYVAAARRVAGLPVGAPFASPLVATVEWGLMVAAYWDGFEELLVHVPPARERLQPGNLERWSNALADLFTEGWSPMGLRGATGARRACS